MFTGNGVPRPGVPAGATALMSGIVEFDLKLAERRARLGRARRGGDFAYERPLRRSRLALLARGPRRRDRRGLFGRVEESPSRWCYRTVAQRGEMWGLRFLFAAPPDRMIRFARDGGTLRGEGTAR